MMRRSYDLRVLAFFWSSQIWTASRNSMMRLPPSPRWQSWGLHTSQFMISRQHITKRKGVVKAYPKSIGNVTGISKLGVNQRRILVLIRVHQCLRFSDLLAMTGLGERQVRSALRPLVSAQHLEY